MVKKILGASIVAIILLMPPLANLPAKAQSAGVGCTASVRPTELPPHYLKDFYFIISNTGNSPIRWLQLTAPQNFKLTDAQQDGWSS